MNKEDLIKALQNSEEFKIIIPDMKVFKEAAAEFPEYEDALFQKLLNDEGEFSRLLNNYWDLATIYGPQGLLTETSRSHLNEIINRIISSDEDYKRIISDMLAFNTFIESFCPPDVQRELMKKFFSTEEFKRLMIAPINTPYEEIRGLPFEIGIDYITHNNDILIGFLKLVTPEGQRLSPENLHTLIQVLLSHNHSFEQAVKTNAELIKLIQEIPQYSKDILAKIFSSPNYFDKLIGNDAGWAAIKPFVTIPVIKDADSFNRARELIPERIRSQELIFNSIFRQLLPESRSSVADSLAADLSGGAKLKK